MTNDQTPTMYDICEHVPTGQRVRLLERVNYGEGWRVTNIEKGYDVFVAGCDELRLVQRAVNKKPAG